MHLVLFPKTFNLAMGVGIGLAFAALGRWVVLGQDNAPIIYLCGILATVGGAWVAASCALTKRASQFWENGNNRGTSFKVSACRA